MILAASKMINPVICDMHTLLVAIALKIDILCSFYAARRSEGNIIYVIVFALSAFFAWVSKNSSKSLLRTKFSL